MIEDLLFSVLFVVSITSSLFFCSKFLLILLIIKLIFNIYIFLILINILNMRGGCSQVDQGSGL